MLFMIYVINTVPCTHVISDLNREEIIEIFYETELQFIKDLGYKNSLKEKETNYMSNGKDMIIHLIAALKKKTYLNETPFPFSILS